MLRIFTTVVFAVLLSFPTLAGTTGAIRAKVINAETQKPIEGVKLEARSSALQGKIGNKTDENGIAELTELPPGKYDVTVLINKEKLGERKIRVEVDSTVSAEFVITLKAGVGEITEGTTSDVNVTDAIVGLTLIKQYIQNVPVGRERDFSNALLLSPSAVPDLFGTSFGGATSAENTYIIDGLNVNGTELPVLDTRLVMDFIDQYQIMEGGFPPEYGRAMAGVVNLLTRSGTNEFKGSIWAYYRPGQLEAARLPVSHLYSAMTSAFELDYYINVGVQLAGPIVKDKLWFHIGYSPEIKNLNVVNSYRFNSGATEPDLDVNGNPVWENVDPAFGVNTPVSVTLPNIAQSHQYTFKLSHLISNETRHSLSVRGSPVFISGYGTQPGGLQFVNGYQSGTNTGTNTIGDPSSFFVNKNWTSNYLSAIYNLTGRYFHNKFKMDATVGVHFQQDNSSPGNAAAAGNGIIYDNQENLRDISTAGGVTIPAACDALYDFPFPANQDPNGNPLSRCPMQYYNKGGVSHQIDQNNGFRVQEKLFLTSLAEFAGLHQIKYGIDFEQVFEKRTREFTGGAEYVSTGDDQGDGAWRIIRYQRAGVPIPRAELNGLTLNFGSFLADTWNPIANLVLNYGARWDVQNLWGYTESAPNNLVSKFTIWDSISPRAGLVWDFTGKGRGAVRFNYGRYYQEIPLRFNEWVFSTVGFQIDNRSKLGCTSDGTPGGTPLTTTQVTNPLVQCPDEIAPTQFEGGKNALLMPGSVNQHSDEFILSADYEPFDSWVFGVVGRYRHLNTIWQAYSWDRDVNELVNNPGEFDLNRMDAIRDQLNQTSNPLERSKLQQILDLAPLVNNLPKAKRETFHLQFKLDKKYSKHFLIQGSYVLGWTYGNYEGGLNTQARTVDPGTDISLKMPWYLANTEGYLPQDVRHNIRLSAYYKADFKDLGICAPFSFRFGAAFYAQSGRAYDFYVLEPVNLYFDELVLPRGSGGRTPWFYDIDLSLGFTWHFTDDMELELFGSIYNLTNYQATMSVDNAYSELDVAQPILRGDTRQLEFLRAPDGTPVRVNPNFGNTKIFSTPLGAQFGARFKF
jgi:hypothetical protein